MRSHSQCADVNVAEWLHQRGAYLLALRCYNSCFSPMRSVLRFCTVPPRTAPPCPASRSAACHARAVQAVVRHSSISISSSSSSSGGGGGGGGGGADGWAPAFCSPPPLQPESHSSPTPVARHTAREQPRCRPLNLAPSLCSS